MVNIIINIVIFIGLFAGGAGLGVLINKKSNKVNLKNQKEKAEKELEESKKEAEQIKLEIKNYVEKRKETIEQESEQKRKRAKKLEENLHQKQRLLNKKEETNKQIKLKAVSLQEEIQAQKENIKREEGKIIELLCKKSEKLKENLKEEILNSYKKELEEGSMEKLNKIETDLKEKAQKTAEKIIKGTIQRLTSPTSVETKMVNILVEKDSIKGKIVGEKAKNIKIIEETLNVDVVFNDLPQTISVSGFNLVNRRIAQKTIEILTKEKTELNEKIIKESIRKAEQETDKELYEIGGKAIEKMGIKHQDKEFIRTVGRLKYRTSYGQNIMKHSMEVAWIARLLASEIGANIKTINIAGFLHDLGKAIDQDPNIDKTHDVLSKELMEKYKFPEEAIHAAWAHHDAEPQKTPEALIIKAADAISASRPGARQESFEKYLERIKSLQETAENFEGVRRAYPLSAGREIRVFVNTEKINDEEIKITAKKMAKKIEEKLSYPGQIKVNLIRRTKHTEITK